jgi:hypothetical protein
MEQRTAEGFAAYLRRGEKSDATVEKSLRSENISPPSPENGRKKASRKNIFFFGCKVLRFYADKLK